jgi:hypothetical protein
MFMNITIVKKLKDPKNATAGHVLQPDTGLPAKVRTGDLVTFLLGDGVSGLSITFTDRSPFGTSLKTVAYDQPLEVTEAHDPKQPRYKYSCRTADGISTDDGGEVEIVHN